MLGRIAAIDHRITHSLVGVVDGHLRSDAPFGATRGSLLHFFEMSKIFLNCCITLLAGFAFHSLCGHGIFVGIVRICIAITDHLKPVLIEFVEVVTSVAQLVRFDAHECKVFNDRVVELHFFIGRVGVIETDKKRSGVLLVGKVVVEKRSLGVSNMEIP